MVEHWTVAPVVAGSIPVIHPNIRDRVEAKNRRVELKKAD